MCDTCGCDGDGAVVTSLVAGGAHTHVYPDGRVETHTHAHDGEGHGHAGDGPSHTHSHDGHTHSHTHDGHTHSHTHDGHTHTHDGHTHSHTHDGHTHSHTHDGHTHSHDHGHDPLHRAFQAAPTTIKLESLQAKVLGKNDDQASRNRRALAAGAVTAVNLMSSPGAGKTTLLTKTLPALTGGPVAVIEGDQATAIDAERIAATGISVVQVNTGKGCHLEADMVEQGVRQLAPAPGTLLVIENVGNLVCPALFDLGESQRVVLLSVTEGDDKPQKYPHMFAVADVVVITKIDLLPHVDFDVAKARASITRLAPAAQFFEVSARTGAGMAAWLAWLDGQRQAASTATEAPWPTR